MTEKQTGGPAFPWGAGFAGMTLRDYFAAKAMQGIFPLCQTNESAAEECYKVADAMLKARDAE